jgi:hypothetical protein
VPCWRSIIYTYNIIIVITIYTCISTTSISNICTSSNTSSRTPHIYTPTHNPEQPQHDSEGTQCATITVPAPLCSCSIVGLQPGGYHISDP